MENRWTGFMGMKCNGFKLGCGKNGENTVVIE